MATKSAEPARPSVEAILTDIHNTLTEGFEAILKKLDEMAEGEFVGEVPEKIEIEEKTPEKEIAAPAEDDIPVFVREWLEANPGADVVALVKEFPQISRTRATTAVKKYGKPTAKKAAAKAEAKKEEKPKITVEALRAKISEFAEAFSMNEALAVNEKMGGSKKVSGIPEEKYAAVFEEMQSRLTLKAEVAQANMNEAAKAAGQNPEITIEDIRRVGKEFVDKNGDPAFRALLKAIAKADKISTTDPKFYPALFEALSNA